MYLLRLRRLSLFLIVWGALISTSSDARPPDFVPHLQVSLFNDAVVPPEVLAQAQFRASAVLAQAGVEVDWLDCPPANKLDFAPVVTPCSAVAWPRHLSVRIVRRGITVGADTFGQAFQDESGCGAYANVYYQNLVASPGHPELGDGEMLGYVIAHELGHLLLGLHSHSDSGVMQAHWRGPVLQAAAKAALFFTPSQAAAIRSRLSSVVVAHL
jgi:hypothetical protein